MKTVRYRLLPNQPLTPEQKERIRIAKQYPIVPDEDCPELTRERLEKMTRVSDRHIRERGHG